MLADKYFLVSSTMQVSKAVSKDGLSVDLSSYAEDDCQSPEAQLVPVGS